ncbi:unnamed protein product [Symbiodinium microadriaticum]|nr:unnamed protein product [Symbiodinium microadriaticum]
MAEQLFIPEKIRVGFQNRNDTYTNKLAYVIYFDSYGKLRKEKSWLGWCDLPKGYKGTTGQAAGNHWRNTDSKGIEPIDFENVPTEGFVLNKGVGGARRSYGWNTRNEYIRVYDPRDFEFEISIANLLFILRECDCSRGKGLEGQFVYAWDGTELVLLPTKCEDYENSKKYTKLQAAKISARDLTPGITYMTKQQDELVYLGRFERHRSYQKDGYCSEEMVDNKKKACQKFHTFWQADRTGKGGKKLKGQFHFLSSMSKLGAVGSETPHPELAELIADYYMSKTGSKVIDLVLKEHKKKKKSDDYYYHRDYLSYEDDDGKFVLYNMSDHKSYYMTTYYKVCIVDDTLTLERYNHNSYPPGYSGHKAGRHYHGYGRDLKWVERKPMKLYAEKTMAKTDAKTLELIKKVQQQKEEIAKAERPNWITNCSFSYTEGSAKAINLHVCRDVLEMVNIVAFLNAREDAYKKAVKELGVDAPTFQWGGFSVADWKKDIKTRIDKVQITDKKKKLEALETRLNKIVSPELRAEMELEAIAAELD